MYVLGKVVRISPDEIGEVNSCENIQVRIKSARLNQVNDIYRVAEGLLHQVCSMQVKT